MQDWWKDKLVHLPIACAVLIEAHIRLYSYKAFGASQPLFASLLEQSSVAQTSLPASVYLLIIGQLLLESIPFFISGFAFHKHCFDKPLKALGLLSLGMFFYPLCSLILASHWQAYGDSTLLSVQGWLLALTATLLWWLHCIISRKSERRTFKWMATLFSLNGVVAILAVGWTFVMTGIFNSTPDPMNNMPLNPLIDVQRIATEFPTFAYFMWQFSVIAALMYGVYLALRKVLIRQILSQHGVLAFGFASLSFLILATPIVSAIVLALPMNIESMTMLPSTDHDIFGKDNYHFMLLFMAVSTPIILAFDRQQQEAQLAQTTQQKTATELQLLQQQINPHFLFNTLNNLYALTLKKSEQAPALVMQLSDLLRYTVYEGQQPRVHLQQEVVYLQNFLSLQKIRLGERCDIQVNGLFDNDNHTLSDEHPGPFVAPLMFIILLENAFKHGVEKNVERSAIALSMTFSEQPNFTEVQFDCKNSVSEDASMLEQHNPNEAGGFGLKNLRRRLELLYPDRFELDSALIEEAGEMKWHAQLTLKVEA